MVFPYPKGFYNNKVGFSILFSRSCVVICYSDLWYLTSGIRALSSAKKKREFFFFLQGFKDKEKEGRDTQVNSCSFLSRI
jgi:hypothetical protein